MLGSNEQGTNGNSGPNPRPVIEGFPINPSFEMPIVIQNTVSSVAAELNSRLSNKMSNQLILTYSRIQDTRSHRQIISFVDIGDGTSSDKSFSNLKFRYNCSGQYT